MCGPANQNDVPLLSDDGAAGEIAHPVLVDRRVLERKVIDILGQRQLGVGELVSDRTRLLLRYLGLERSTADQLLGSCLRLCGVASVASWALFVLISRTAPSPCPTRYKTPLEFIDGPLDRGTVRGARTFNAASFMGVLYQGTRGRLFDHRSLPEYLCELARPPTFFGRFHARRRVLRWNAPYPQPRPVGEPSSSWIRTPPCSSAG